jgi:hypothetical protein
LLRREVLFSWGDGTSGTWRQARSCTVYSHVSSSRPADLPSVRSAALRVCAQHLKNRVGGREPSRGEARECVCIEEAGRKPLMPPNSRKRPFPSATIAWRVRAGGNAVAPRRLPVACAV